MSEALQTMTDVDDGASPARPTQWFHSFDLAGERIEGHRGLDTLRAEAEVVFRHGVEGRRVLDIGAWDGFFAFEAERRGAAAVLAADHFCWSGEGWGTRAGFDYVHTRLGSRVGSVDVDVYDLRPEVHGSFDVVLLMGVLYHVKDPYRCLETAAAMCTQLLVIETETGLEHEKVAAMRLYSPGELNNDGTNIWAPNTAALRALLNRFGFSRVEITTSPGFQLVDTYRRSTRGRLRRLLVRLGLRPQLPEADRGRVIVHAWR